jgi:hypothetical protein
VVTGAGVVRLKICRRVGLLVVGRSLSERAAHILNLRCQSMFYSAEPGSFIGLTEQLPAVSRAVSPLIQRDKRVLLRLGARHVGTQFRSKHLRSTLDLRHDNRLDILADRVHVQL